MSYLPRMSKTYKEPQEIQEEPEEKLSPGSIKPASALLNEKTYNPQMALKHYRYIPHPPPVLPGPSVLEEALENEILKEAYRVRKSSVAEDDISKGSEVLSEQISIEPATTEENSLKQDSTEKIKRMHSRKNIKGSKSSVGKRRFSKSVKKEPNVVVNMHLTVPNKPLTALTIASKSQTVSDGFEYFTKEEKLNLKREKTVLPIVEGEIPSESAKPTLKSPPVEEKQETKQKELSDRTVQCTILESPSKMIAIPPIIHSLIRVLGFLFQEIKKEEALSNCSPENKFPMSQAQLILNELSNQKISKDLGFDLTYSDFKRLEKISGDFQKYIKEIYGDQEQFVDKMEDLKRVFIESKIKEMELTTLRDKIQEQEEKEDEEIILKEEDLRNPEITLQNKRLESEQLSAEVEFSSRELKKCQKTIGELDWDIRNYQEKVISLKKSVPSKSKTEVLGKKSSVHKFSSETLSKVSRNSETSRKKT